MKTINTYITEKLKIDKSKLKGGVELTLFPENFKELNKMIIDEMQINGNECSLNHIDVSKITNFSYLFFSKDLRNFNCDISEWDVSNAIDMQGMFRRSNFNGDISKWDVSNVKDMASMFSESKFNGNISKWNVSSVKTMSHMFYYSEFNRDIADWDVSNVTNMYVMFMHSIFNQTIGNWNVSNVTDMTCMFAESKFNQDISNWNVDKSKTTDLEKNPFVDCGIKNEYKPAVYRNHLHIETNK